MEDLNSILEEYDILYAFLADFANGKIREFGDRNLLAFQDIVNQHFGSEQSVLNLKAHLDESILPQTVRQGKVCCVLTKPDSEKVIGLFFHDEGDLLARRRKAKDLDKAVKDAFGSSGDCV